MADNYLERQYDDYLARKAAAEKAKRLKWQKQLKAYRQKLASRNQNLQNDGQQS